MCFFFEIECVASFSFQNITSNCNHSVIILHSYLYFETLFLLIKSICTIFSPFAFSSYIVDNFSFLFIHVDSLFKTDDNLILIE